MLLNLNNAYASDAFEIIATKFKPEVSHSEQEQAMQTLNEIVKQFDGFKSRDYYYSNESQYWFDFIVWENLELAKQASEQVMQNTQATEIFSLLDQDQTIFSHYEHMGGATK